MREFTLEMEALPWKLQRDAAAPTDKLVLSMAPNGKTRVTFGRVLLPWSKWLTVDEFAMWANRLCK